MGSDPPRLSAGKEGKSESQRITRWIGTAFSLAIAGAFTLSKGHGQGWTD